MDARIGSLWHKTAGEATPRINPRHRGGPVCPAVRLSFQVFLKTLCGAVIVILNATSFFCFQIVDLFDGELDVELRAGSNGDHGGLTEGEHVRPGPELAGLVYEEVVSVVVILVS